MAGPRAGVFTADTVDAIAGSAFGASVARIPFMFFVGTLVVITPRVVFAVAVDIGGAT